VSCRVTSVFSFHTVGDAARCEVVYVAVALQLTVPDNNNIAFQERQTTHEQDTETCFDLDLDTITLIYERWYSKDICPIAHVPE